MRLRLGLHAKYSFIFVMMILVIVAVLSTAFFLQIGAISDRLGKVGERSLTLNLISQLEDRGTFLAEHLAQSLVVPMQTGNYEQWSAQINATKRHPEVEFVRLYNQSGAELYAYKNLSSPEPTVPFRLETAEPNPVVSISEALVSIQTPVMGQSSESPLGYVQLGLTTAWVNGEMSLMNSHFNQATLDESKQFAVVSIFLTVILTLLGIGFAIRITNKLSEPIRKLVHYANEIGQGNHAAKLPIRRSDEIGELAESLRSMSQNLQNSGDEVRYLAYHDSLTGLPNRVMCLEYLDFIIDHAERQNQAAVIMFIDLDDFKLVNDTLGHDAGDWLLKEVSERIKSCIRDADLLVHRDSSIEAVVSRLGGDEFTVILPDVAEPLNAAIVARRIIDVVSAPFILKEQEVVVGASIGMASYPKDGVTVEALLKNADLAMYQAKSEGKNAYQFYTNAMNVRALNKLSLESDLRKALEKNQLRLWYQPLVDIDTGNVIGAEALLRWYHPTRGLISPLDFIPIAERTGLIVPIGEWIVRTACRQARRWQLKLDPEFHVAVNFSSVQFRRQEVATVVKTALSMANLAPESLHVEITETSLMHSDKRAHTDLDILSELGVKIWVDDFGTGYSSLSYLRQFPVSGVKIDRSFVKDIEHDEGDRALVSAIISMTRSLGLGVVAEGVESEKQLQFLKHKQCAYVQGDYLGRPMTVKEFEDMMFATQLADTWVNTQHQKTIAN